MRLGLRQLSGSADAESEGARPVRVLALLWVLGPRQHNRVTSESSAWIGACELLFGLLGPPAPGSANDVARAGDEQAGASGLAPNPLVRGPRMTLVVVAGAELARFDPKLAVEQVKFLDARM